jgi:hypothetical protein
VAWLLWASWKLWYAPVHKVLTDSSEAECEKSGWGGPLNTFGLFRNFSSFNCKFLWRCALFFKTEMDNLYSDSTWSKMQTVSIERYRIWGISVLCASVNAILSPKTATHSSNRKVSNPCTITQHPWYRSVNKKYYSIRVKFEVGFVICFTRRSMSNKSGTFHQGMVHPFFQKRCLKNFP